MLCQYLIEVLCLVRLNGQVMLTHTLNETYHKSIALHTTFEYAIVNILSR